MDFDMEASAAQQELTMQDLADDAGPQPTAAGDQDDHEQQQHQQQPADGAHEKQQQQQELTPLVEAGLSAMDSRRREIHGKIDVLCQAGLAFLEQVKQQFSQSMDAFKSQVDTFCSDQVANNTQESEETIAAMARLSRAQQLVESLGLEARHRPQQACEDD